MTLASIIGARGDYKITGPPPPVGVCQSFAPALENEITDRINRISQDEQASGAGAVFFSSQCVHPEKSC